MLKVNSHTSFIPLGDVRGHVVEMQMKSSSLGNRVLLLLKGYGHIRSPAMIYIQTLNFGSHGKAL